MRQDLTSASIWRLIWLHRYDILLSWDLWVAAGGAVASVALKPSQNTVVLFASSAISVMSAIIGIVLAGLAIITAFLDRKYVAVLNKVGHGLATEVFNFRYPAAVAIVNVIFSAVLILAQNESWYSSASNWLMPVSIFFFLYALFITLNLIASIGGNLMNRSTQLNSERERHNPKD